MTQALPLLSPFSNPTAGRLFRGLRTTHTHCFISNAGDCSDRLLRLLSIHRPIHAQYSTPVLQTRA